MLFLFGEEDLGIVCVGCGEENQSTSVFAPVWRDCEIHSGDCFKVVCPRCGVFERDCGNE